MRTAQIAATLAALGHFDAGETAVFARQLEHIRTQIVEAEFPAFRLRDFVPMESGVDAGAESFTWYFFTQTGVAKMISTYATDFPYVNDYGSKNNTPIESIGVGFKYNVQEVRAATKANYQLEARRGRLAREAIERLADKIGAHGDAARNVPGFLNNANVPLVTVGINGHWTTTATAAQMYADLFLIGFSVWTQSKQIHKSNTILLPTALYSKVASTPYSTTIPDTVLEVFQRSFPFPMSVDTWVELDLADAQLDGPRVVTYEKSPDNLGLVWPIEFESMPPQPDNLDFKVPCHARVGGVIIYRPLAFTYVDALAD